MPQTKIVTDGVCNFCKETLPKSKMTRHLAMCRRKRYFPSSAGKAQPTFWILAEGKFNPEYWIHIEISASATLAMLDGFLRDIWLECCGHLSAFTIKGVRYEVDTGGVDAMWSSFFGPSKPPQSMKIPLGDVLAPGMTFEHEYDFGSTTWLKLKVIAEEKLPLKKRDLSILSRNNPPNILCARCKSPATLVCAVCVYDGPKAWLCEKHAQTHKCGEDMMLPAVNSPRAGVCAYVGDAKF